MNVLVLIPAYNASASLPSLLERTLHFVIPQNIVVINDGSNDATSELAKQHKVVVLNHDANRGKGASLQTGFTYALTSSSEAVITMDADLQHKPEDIPRFIDLYKQQHCEIILGSRLHNKSGMPLHRILSNTITTCLVNARTGKRILDSQSGFRLIKKDVLEVVHLSSSGFEAETEFLIKAAACGFSFSSLPIDTIYAGEKSHMTHLKTTINFIKTLFRQY